MPLVLVPDHQEMVGLFTLGGPFVGMSPGTAASATWPTSNLAIFIPVRVTRAMTIAQLAVFNGTAVSGNLDVGLYDAAGTRLISSGSTAQTGTLVNQVLNVTDTRVDVGTYYLAMAMDNTTGTTIRYAAGVEIYRGCGLAQQASAFPLPATATFASLSVNYLPLVTGTSRTVFV